MRLSDVGDEELVRLRDSYRASIRRETQASPDTRRMWFIVVAALNDVLARRGGPIVVLDPARMCRPGDEPLA
jgi:hypothetical protein